MPFFGIPIRNGLPIGLGSAAGFGIAPFSPASLFENGEEGVWFDPSDYTTLFQDSAGTTPVTAVEQPVGLMLDKSKGLVLGSELVTNGDFSSGANWTAATGWSIGGGVASCNAIAGANLDQTLVTTIGKIYAVSYTITSYTSGSVYARFTGSVNVTGVSRSSAGTFTEYINATSNNSVFRMRSSDIGFVGSIDNISVRELPGNHAYQSTSASRPTLRARYNLLTYSEEFDNATVWTKNNANVSSNTVVAPDGTLTADKLIGTGNNPFIFQTNIIANGANVMVSIYAKSSELSWLRLTVGSAAVCAAWFNLSLGYVGTVVGTGVAAEITPDKNGFYLCKLLITSALGTGPVIACTNGDGVTTGYTGNGTDGIYIWGAQLIVANSLPSNNYQRVAAATDYDTSGFLPYLSFDGTDDSMLTNSIDFSAGDKMTVWAGVRKLSDAAIGAAIESSANPSANTGAFSVLAPATAGATYRFASIGTANFSSALTSASYASPITNVLTGIGDISGDVSTLRVNAVQAATNTIDQGIGNYGNYPLYIGARAGTSLWFNGWLTSLIVRGAQSTDAQIEATENWVNGKTGVQFDFVVRTSDGGGYSVPFTALNSSGTSYNIPNTVRSSSGVSYII
jgi:hypothetical protein